MTSTKQLFDIILGKLNSRRPFSFIRYGDGEAMLLNSIIEAQIILQRQFGYTPVEKVIEEIREHLITAYHNSHTVGFPTQKHLERNDQWNKCKDVFEKHIGKVSGNFASIDASYEMLEQRMLDNLLQGRKKINYISCRNLTQAFKNKYNIGEINPFTIAPEAKFTSGYNGIQHYPDQFINVKGWINQVTEPGDLCLVGAGVTGKIYNVWFANAGGVSLDLGGVFDLWAGKKTRGQGRGLDIEDLTFKL